MALNSSASFLASDEVHELWAIDSKAGKIRDMKLWQASSSSRRTECNNTYNLDGVVQILSFFFAKGADPLVIWTAPVHRR